MECIRNGLISNALECFASQSIPFQGTTLVREGEQGVRGLFLRSRQQVKSPGGEYHGQLRFLRRRTGAARPRAPQRIPPSLPGEPRRAGASSRTSPPLVVCAEEGQVAGFVGIGSCLRRQAYGPGSNVDCSHRPVQRCCSCRVSCWRFCCWRPRQSLRPRWKLPEAEAPRRQSPIRARAGIHPNRPDWAIP